MKIGIFDSGLGGLVMARAFHHALPGYDFMYLGDSLRAPYGRRSDEAIYQFTHDAVDYLFEHDCALVVVACNTASASALRRLQKDYLPHRYPDRRILGVIVPTLEAVLAGPHRNIGLIGTVFTVNSQIYPEELKKINPAIKFHAKATPLLVPLVECNAIQYAPPILQDYLQPLIERGIDSLILGCTHYPMLRSMIRDILPPSVDIIGQDEVIPPKLLDYLARHPEIEAKLSKKDQIKALLTDVTPFYEMIGNHMFGRALHFDKVTL